MKHKYISEVEFEKGVFHTAQIIQDLFENCGEVEKVLIDFASGTITVVKDEYNGGSYETEREV